MSQATVDLSRAIMNFSPAAIVVIDQSGDIRLFNPKAEDLFGFSAGDVVGKPLTMLFPQRYHEQYKSFLSRSLQQETAELELLVIRRDQVRVPVGLLVGRMRLSEGYYYLLFFHDLRPRKKREAKIRQLSLCDSVTGLLNYHAFILLLNQKIEQRESFILLYLGLDRFVPIVEVLGHDVADEVLKKISKRLVAMGLDRAHIARVGGSRFAILYDGDDGEQPLTAAQAVHACLEQPLRLRHLYVDVEASIGAVCYPQHCDSAMDLMRGGEIAMRCARRQQTMCAVYDASMALYQLDHLNLISELRHAIEHGELVVYYQPKIDMLQKEVSAAEALVRWQHPTKGMIRPDFFIPAAEESGVIHAFTQWLFDQTCQQVLAWQSKGMRVRVSLNLAPRNLLETDLIERLRSTIQKWKIPPSLLMMEITERGLMADPQRTIEVLAGIRQLGVGISIDDFGTGHSSLAYLKDFPANELKIDQRFVRGLHDDKRASTIVSLIIQMASALNMQVIAEGVETLDEWTCLQGMGCVHAQGFLMGKPMPADEFESWFLASSWNGGL